MFTWSMTTNGMGCISCKPRNLILRNHQSPGDIVMLTAAVRDLHRGYPGKFVTDVRTSCPALWENNPNITRLADDDPEATVLECEYPLIHRSNGSPHHFLHAFIEHLNDRLGVQIRGTEFRGDIHIGENEKRWMSQVHELTGEDTPFWIVVAGGKWDYTLKWWDPRRYQRVVDHFRGRIQFVQVGERGHWHPRLDGALDLRGRTDLRQLVRLVYHAQGVLCPVTALMHLAAAVETRPGRPKNRACVVVAGGREPMQWEAYPHHQYIHTNGQLLCCDHGGCWKSRIAPLGDGDTKDGDAHRCLQPIATEAAPHPAERFEMHGGTGWNEAWQPEAAVRATQTLPRCLDQITAEEVIRRIEGYYTGGALQRLTPEQAAAASLAVAAQHLHAEAGPQPESDAWRSPEATNVETLTAV